MDCMNISEHAGLHGRIAVATYEMRPEWEGLSYSKLLSKIEGSEPVERVEVQNVLCVNGLGILVSAINWSAIEDQNANMGSPFSTTYLAPIYGAVGTGNTAVVDTDTKLTTESTNTVRAIAIAGATSAASHSNPATVAWSFIFGLPVSGSTVVAEAGVFVQATATADSGSILDHALISPTVTQTSTQILTVVATFSVGN